MTPLEKLGHNPKFQKELKKAYRRIKISAFFFKIWHPTVYKLKVKLFFFFHSKPLLDNLRDLKFFDEVWKNEYFD